MYVTNNEKLTFFAQKHKEIVKVLQPLRPYLTSAPILILKQFFWTQALTLLADVIYLYSHISVFLSCSLMIFLYRFKYLMVLIFAGTNFRGFCRFWSNSRNKRSAKYSLRWHRKNYYLQKNLKKPKVYNFSTLGRHIKKFDLNKARAGVNT